MADERVETCLTCESAVGFGSSQSLGSPGSHETPTGVSARWVRRRGAKRSKSRRETRLVGTAEPNGSKDAAPPLLHAPRAARVGNRRLTLAAFLGAFGGAGGCGGRGARRRGCGYGNRLLDEEPRSQLRPSFRHRLDGARHAAAHAGGAVHQRAGGSSGRGRVVHHRAGHGRGGGAGREEGRCRGHLAHRPHAGHPHIVLLILISFALGKASGASPSAWP